MPNKKGSFGPKRASNGSAQATWQEALVLLSLKLSCIVGWAILTSPHPGCAVLASSHDV